MISSAKFLSCSQPPGVLATFELHAFTHCSPLPHALQAYPLDLVRTRLAAQTQGNYYHGILPTLQRIVADEGAVGLYRGLGATLLQVRLSERCCCGGSYLPGVCWTVQLQVLFHSWFSFEEFRCGVVCLLPRQCSMALRCCRLCPL